MSVSVKAALFIGCEIVLLVTPMMFPTIPYEVGLTAYAVAAALLIYAGTIWLWPHLPWGRREVDGALAFGRRLRHPAPKAMQAATIKQEKAPSAELVTIRDAADQLYGTTRAADIFPGQTADYRLRYHIEQLLSIAKRGHLVVHGRFLPAPNLAQLGRADLQGMTLNEEMTGLKYSGQGQELKIADLCIAKDQIGPVAQRIVDSLNALRGSRTGASM